MRCDHIVEELFDFTRTAVEFEGQPTVVDAWLSHVLDEHYFTKGLSVRLELGLPGLSLSMDPHRMRRAIINVIENAGQAMRNKDNMGWVNSGACVTVSTHSAGRRVEIVVVDNGPGIPKDVIAKIFEPLFSTKGFGLGLGLPTVKQILEQHDGGVEIESDEGQGTRVVLWLPAN